MSPTLLRLNTFLGLDASTSECAIVDRDAIAALFRYLGLPEPSDLGQLSCATLRDQLSAELERQNRYLFKLSTAGWVGSVREFPRSAFVDEILACNMPAR